MGKCLNFRLPTGSAGMAAGMTKQAINKKLIALIDQDKISSFKTKLNGYNLKVWLGKESDYTVFFLVWDQSNPWHKPTITDEDYTQD